ncbi:exonuclease domain-containing protein [Kitasatospora sp. NPDC002551]|uniref:exonuclease domain-containing protein n=1 Tax=Kitasatospora sp. NPDC002551 TaxID=3154539 RepID=UPI00331EB65C
MSAWWLDEWAALDLETTGLDVETDRIVTAALARVLRGVPVETRTWLADAGQKDIPLEAVKVHGITSKVAHRHGRPVDEVVGALARELAELPYENIPLVVANAPFDLTLLTREHERTGRSWPQGHHSHRIFVLDPLLLDWKLDQGRDGRRRLVDLCEHYDVVHAGPHRADADAAAAAAVTYQIVSQYPELRQMSLAEVHERQVGWAVERAAARQRRLRKNDPTAVVDGRWPLIPRQEVAR